MRPHANKRAVLDLRTDDRRQHATPKFESPFRITFHTPGFPPTEIEFNLQTFVLQRLALSGKSEGQCRRTRALHEARSGVHRARFSRRAGRAMPDSTRGNELASRNERRPLLDRHGYPSADRGVDRPGARICYLLGERL